MKKPKRLPALFSEGKAQRSTAPKTQESGAGRVEYSDIMTSKSVQKLGEIITYGLKDTLEKV